MHIVGVKHCGVGSDFDHGTFYFGQIFETVNPFQTKVVRLNVKDRANITLTVSDAAT